MYLLLLVHLATLTLANLTYANITLPPFIPQLPERPYKSTLPYGVVLNHCSIPGTIALTFDDGPYIYTAQMLDTLAQHGARATFFLNGHHRGHIDQFPDLVKRAHAEGHQLASHTWTHLSLPTLPADQIKHQMTALDSAFDRILGFHPTYMRAPYLELTDAVLRVLAELQYHVIGASIDTKDYEYDHPETNWHAFERFLDGLDAGGTLVLAHDSHFNTVEILVDNMLAEIEMRGLSTVTVGECLGDNNWYRTG